MSDDENDEDYGYIDSDEEISYDTLNDAVETNDIDIVKNYLKTNKITIEDNVNKSIEINNYEILQLLLKNKVNINNKSLDLAFRSSNNLIIKLIIKEVERNKIEQIITSEGVNGFLKTTNVSQLFRVYKEYLKKCNNETILLAIKTNNIPIIDYIFNFIKENNPDCLKFNYEKGNLLNSAIETGNIEVLNNILDLNFMNKKVSPNSNTLNTAINTKNINVLLKVLDFIKRPVNDSELKLINQIFPNIEMNSLNINYDNDIPLWKNYCAEKLGLLKLGELRKILLDSQIIEIDSVPVQKLTKDKICSFLDTDYMFSQVTLKNNLYRCKNNKSMYTDKTISPDDDYIMATDDLVMTDCISVEDAEMSYDVKNDMFLGRILSDELSERIKTYLKNKPKLNRKVHQNIKLDDTSNLNNLFDQFYYLDNRINLNVLNIILSLDNDEWNQFFNDISLNMGISKTLINNYYENTLQNKY